MSSVKLLKQLISACYIADSRTIAELLKSHPKLINQRCKTGQLEGYPLDFLFYGYKNTEGDQAPFLNMMVWLFIMNAKHCQLPKDTGNAMTHYIVENYKTLPAMSLEVLVNLVADGHSFPSSITAEFAEAMLKSISKKLNTMNFTEDYSDNDANLIDFLIITLAHYSKQQQASLFHHLVIKSQILAVDSLIELDTELQRLYCSTMDDVIIDKITSYDRPVAAFAHYYSRLRFYCQLLDKAIDIDDLGVMSSIQYYLIHWITVAQDNAFPFIEEDYFKAEAAKALTKVATCLDKHLSHKADQMLEHITQAMALCNSMSDSTEKTLTQKYIVRRGPFDKHRCEELGLRLKPNTEISIKEKPLLNFKHKQPADHHENNNNAEVIKKIKTDKILQPKPLN